MIPLKLTLKGIYSYQKEQTIDFSTLTENHIFGIFGGVGSGKSTILEAITFALYGDTERLNSRENRNYNMMNLKSDELFIEFIFSSGKESTQYRFVVSAKRNKKTFTNVSSYKRIGYKLDNGSWIPLESAKAEDIIGLSYENFKRTIIIPQGKFQEFLQLGDADRTKMLQEIFRLDRFDLSDKVKSLYIKVDKDIQHLNGRLMELDSVSPQLLAEQKQALKSTKAELTKSEEESKALQTKLITLDNLEKLYAKKESLTNKISAQRQDENEIDALELKLNKYLSCKELFEHDIKSLYKIQDEHNILSSFVQNNIPKLQRIEDDLAISREQYSKLEIEFGKKSDYLNELDKLNTVIKIKDIDGLIVAKKNTISKTQSNLETQSSKYLTQKDNLATKELQLENLRTIKEELSKLKEIESWHKRKLYLVRNLNNYSEKLENATKKKNNTFKELDNIYDGNKHFADISKNDLKSLIKKIEAVTSELEVQKDAEREKLVTINARTAIALEAQNLKEGDPCPVCGSTSHPAIQEYEEGKTAAKALTKILDNIDAQFLIINHQKKQLSKIEATLSSIEESRQEYTAEMQKINIELGTLYKEYIWDDLYKEEKTKLTEEIASCEEKVSTYNTLSGEVSNLKSEIELLSNNIDVLKQTLSKSEIEKERLMSERNTLLSSLGNDFFAEYSNFNNNEIVGKIRAIENHLLQTEAEFKQIGVKVRDLEQEYTSLDTTLKLKQEQIKAVDTEITVLQSSINQNIESSAFKSIDEIKTILDKNLDKKSISDKIETFRKELSVLENEFNTITREIDGKEYNPGRHKELNENLELLKSRIKSIVEKIGSLQSDIDKISESLNLKETLTSELKSLSLRKENIQVLSGLFKGRGFVNYISKIYLKQLCHNANSRFSTLTNRQLLLELNENNNFEVRDFMNEGNIRSVKTLSGGQTFQASLSLALSLAESVPSQSETKQNFFFLDEGFGSLDRESLQIVFDTLKALRKENRIVGLISHVEELQEEVDVYLKLKNDPDTGTEIRKSWTD